MNGSQASSLERQARAITQKSIASLIPLSVHSSGVEVAATEQDLPDGLLTYASYLVMPSGFGWWKVTMAFVIVVSTDIVKPERTFYFEHDAWYKKVQNTKDTFTYPTGICHFEW